MSASRIILPFVAAVMLAGLPASEAQTPSTSSAISSSASSAPAGKWSCLARQTVEIAPVSYDTRGQTNAWVAVYRSKGEIIASERIDARQIEQLRRMPCGSPDAEFGVLPPLVG
jgi:hypothetical protein